MSDDFLDPEEVARLGLARVGIGVRISRHALILGPERMSIGDRVRIDAFVILSAGSRITIGRNVHLSAHSVVLGRGSVEIGDFASISVRCTIFSSNDDYSGDRMINPTIPDRFRGAVDGSVMIGPHAGLAAGVIVLPNVTIGASAVVGAASFVKADVPPFAIVAGVPARQIGERRRGHLTLAEQMLQEEASGS